MSRSFFMKFSLDAELGSTSRKDDTSENHRAAIYGLRRAACGTISGSVVFVGINRYWPRLTLYWEHMISVYCTYLVIFLVLMEVQYAVRILRSSGLLYYFLSMEWPIVVYRHYVKSEGPCRSIGNTLDGVFMGVYWRSPTYYGHNLHLKKRPLISLDKRWAQ